MTIKEEVIQNVNIINVTLLIHLFSSYIESLLQIKTHILQLIEIS